MTSFLVWKFVVLVLPATRNKIIEIKFYLTSFLVWKLVASVWLMTWNKFIEMKFNLTRFLVWELVASMYPLWMDGKRNRKERQWSCQRLLVLFNLTLIYPKKCCTKVLVLYEFLSCKCINFCQKLVTCTFVHCSPFLCTMSTRMLSWYL